MLPDLLPGRSFEVINAGFHGFDSFRAEDAAAQILAFHPDLIVWRAGYNDYQMFAARHLPTRAEAAALSARLWLTQHSRFYNLLRWLCGVRSDKVPGVPWLKPLTPAELEALAADYRKNITRTIAQARNAGVPIILLDLPYAAAFDPDSGALQSFPRLAHILRTLAQEEKIPFAALQDQLPVRLFIDNVHLDSEGYRLTALALCRTLSEHGLLAPRAQWRWGRLRPARAYAHALGLQDNEFLSHLHVGLALFYLQRGDASRAEAELREAERIAPNADLVFQELSQRSNPRILALLGAADRKLGFRDRADRANASARSASDN
jgi:lysophospholipase L1-like esterase